MALMDFSLDGIGNLFTSAREAITGEKILDPKEMKELEFKFMQLEQASQNGQLAINKEEATNPNLFVSGWRPAVGWVGVTSLFFMYVPKAIVMTSFWCYNVYLTLTAPVGTVIPALPIFPDLGTGEIIGLLMSILGVGVMRSWDKKNGTDTKVIGNK